MTQSPPSSAIVIGNGIVGLSCAVELQRRGIATTLIGPSPHTNAASIGNAGHIAIEQVEPLASRAMIRSLPRRLAFRGGPVSLPLRDIGAWLPFSLRLLRAASPGRFARGTKVLRHLLSTALPAWRRLVREIGAEHLLRQDGHYVVWESQSTASAGRAKWCDTDCGEAEWRDATPAELDVLRTLVQQPLVAGIRFSGSGQIVDLDALLRALRNHFFSLGGTFRQGDAIAVAPGGTVELADGERVHAASIIVAAGVGSRRLLEPLGMRVPIIAERGYHIQSASSDWPATLPPVVFEDRSMIVTRFATGLRAAGFVEFARENSPADPGKWRRLQAHVEDLGLSFPKPVARWFGARPTLPDYLPAIGRSLRHPEIVYAFGHQHLGLTLAATTAEEVGRILAGDPPAFELDRLSLDRFV